MNVDPIDVVARILHPVMRDDNCDCGGFGVSEHLVAEAVVAALTEAGMLVTERPTLQVGDRVEWTNRHGVVFDGAIVATDLAQVFGNGVYTTLSADRLRIRLVSHAGGES